MIAFKLAVRNLLRNRWRSGLTLAGVAVAVGLMVWTLAFYEGWIDAMVRGATAVETGQVQVQTAGWADNPRIYESFPLTPGMLDTVAAVPGVAAVSPRIEAYGLVGNERRSQVTHLVGVDPEREARATPVTDGLREGRWLSPGPAPEGEPREVVLGADLATQLRAAPGDSLVVFLEAADGSLGNDVLRVVGTVRTGNNETDRSAAWLNLADAQRLTALDGRVHELLVRTGDLAAARETAASIAGALHARLGAPPEGSGVPEGTLVVRPWQDILPSIDRMIRVFRRLVLVHVPRGLPGGRGGHPEHPAHERAGAAAGVRRAPGGGHAPLAPLPHAPGGDGDAGRGRGAPGGAAGRPPVVALRHVGLRHDHAVGPGVVLVHGRGVQRPHLLRADAGGGVAARGGHVRRGPAERAVALGDGGPHRSRRRPSRGGWGERLGGAVAHRVAQPVAAPGATAILGSVVALTYGFSLAGMGMGDDGHRACWRRR